MAQRQSNVKDYDRKKRVMKNLLTDLIIHEKIVTTKAKAKELSRKMDKLVTFAKEGSIHSRREVSKHLRKVSILTKKLNKNKKPVEIDAVQKLFSTIAPKMKNKNGGYTQVLNYGFRRGDAAEMAVVSFIK